MRPQFLIPVSTSFQTFLRKIAQEILIPILCTTLYMRPAESNSFQLTGLYAVPTATSKATKAASDVVMDVEILLLLTQCYIIAPSLVHLCLADGNGMQ